MSECRCPTNSTALARISHTHLLRDDQVLAWLRQRSAIRPRRINKTPPGKLLVFLARQALTIARDNACEKCGITVELILDKLSTGEAQDQSTIRGPPSVEEQLITQFLSSRESLSSSVGAVADTPGQSGNEPRRVFVQPGIDLNKNPEIPPQTRDGDSLGP